MNLTRKAGLQSTDAVERETITPGIGVSTPNSTERMMTLTGLLCIYFVSLYQFHNNLPPIVAEPDPLCTPPPPPPHLPTSPPPICRRSSTKPKWTTPRPRTTPPSSLSTRISPPMVVPSMAPLEPKRSPTQLVVAPRSLTDGSNGNGSTPSMSSLNGNGSTRSTDGASTSSSTSSFTSTTSDSKKKKKKSAPPETPYVAPSRWDKVKGYSTAQRSFQIWTFAFQFFFKFFLVGRKFTYGKLGMTPERVSARKRELAKWLVEGLVRLGPTFIKIGQQFSTRVDVLSKEFIEELERLQDDVPAFDKELARDIV